MQTRSSEPEYKKIPPSSVYVFRTVPPSQELFFPEKASRRYCTDVPFFIIFVLFIFLLIGSALYLSFSVNLRKILNGQDSCGNLCGVRNGATKMKSEDCVPQDYTNQTLLYYSVNTTRCIKAEECRPPKRKLFFLRCFSTQDANVFQKIKYIHEVCHFVGGAIIPIVVMFSVATGLVIVMYLCFYCNSRATFIGLIASAGISSISITCFSWYMYLIRKEHSFLIPSLISSIYLGGIILLLLFLSDNYHLVIRLYMETILMIFKIPQILLQPLVTIAFILGLDVLLIYLIFILNFEEANDPPYFEKTRGWYIFFVVFILYWLFAFANGCQCMIIAGVVVAYYFTRDPSTVRRAYCKSLWVTLRYHLGTVAAGALVITFLRILKPILGRIEKKHKNVILGTVETCSQQIRENAEYLTKKAYVVTALHGSGIYVSGVRATRLLCLFLCDSVFIDFMGCVTMHAVSFLFIVYSILVGLVMMTRMKLKYTYVSLIIGGCFAGTSTFFYVSVMNIIIETLIVCFCEDRLLNTGHRYNPFFMSSDFFNLMIDALDMTYRESTHYRDSS